MLVHAAGSGTGNLTAQVASNVFGATVIGTASTSKLDKVPLPLKQVVDYSGFPDDLASKLRTMTPNNRGFDVVLDGVGKSTAACSLDSARVRGMVVYFGNTSGDIPPIEPQKLSVKGSLFVTRPRLHDYIATQEELLERAKDVFSWVREGKVKVILDKEFSTLESVDEAMEYVRRGVTNGGKVVTKL